jgi:general secretion pathway protein I
VSYPKPVRKNSGFTLLETLVALAILAISLAAVLRATGAATNHAGEMRIRLLADWVAQNRLALHAARGDWIQVGIQNGEETQAGVRLLWKEEIITTPNPAFRRIEISVSDSVESGDHVLRKLSGYLVQVSRK